MKKSLTLAATGALFLNGCAYMEEKGWWPIADAEQQQVTAPDPQSPQALESAVVLDQLFVGGFAGKGEANTAVVPNGPRQAVDGNLSLSKADYSRVEFELRNAPDQTAIVAFDQWKADRIFSENIGQADVEQAQNMLKSLGYYDGRVDGLAGPQTAQAIKSFESDRGMPVEGKVSEALLQALAVNL